MTNKPKWGEPINKKAKLEYEKMKKETEEFTYKDYVKPELLTAWIDVCHLNCMDFYSCGCLLSAQLIMQELMHHTFKGFFKEQKLSPKEAWENTMRQTDYHSGASAAATACMVAKYSPRGEEFKAWCKKDDVVMVKWS